MGRQAKKQAWLYWQLNGIPAMPLSPLIPAVISFDSKGHPWSDLYQDIYHSKEGGLEETLHVFLSGNNLPKRWQNQSQFTILETGFGLGLNFLMTWKTWLEDRHHPKKLHFISLEKHPFQKHDLIDLLEPWTLLKPYSQELISSWPLPLPGLHRIAFNQGKVSLTLGFGEALELLKETEATVDAYYLDGFTPSRNPDLWSIQLCQQLARLAHPQATLATYTVASNVRAALQAAGFETAKCPGFGRKRHMLSGQLSHHYKKKAAYPADKKSKQHAAIIGAGLAGSALTESLARRGWEIDLFEQNAKIAQGASGNSAGILMPLLSRDDNTASKLTRAGFLYTRQQAIRLEALGMNPGFNACGVMLCARNEKEESDFSALTAPFSWPEAFVQPINQSQGSCLAGWPLPAGGLYFPQAGTISPRHYCQALLGLYPNQVHHHFNCIVMTVKRINQSWYLYDQSGQIICCAPVLIMANAANTVKMGLDMPIRAIRGQISSLPAVNRHAPKLALCNRGYVTPQIDHYIHFGATYDEIDDPDISLSSHSENFDRLNELMPGFVHDPIPWGQVEGRVAFRAVSPDRLPLVGPIASPQPIKPGTKNRNIQREPGLYTLTGLGSRGLAWAPLCAEIIACSLNHEPAPIERKLIQALDPVRFALRKANHQS